MNNEYMGGALSGERLRVVVSTDIGGTDPDDFQSMVHYLLYSDMFDTEGLISSPFDQGSAADIHTVIDAYEKDYPLLFTWSERYPAPDALRALVKQGALKNTPYKGWGAPTEGSEWMIRCARRSDPRPLYLLLWGSMDDLAQALHDAPDILPKLRVHCIAGPNKKWAPNAYAYITERFPDLWMIEDNTTYRGFFMGGDTSEGYDNAGFVANFAAGRGALGAFFASKLRGVLKMGDTPTVTRLLRGSPENPEQDSWGGRFTPVDDMPCAILHHPITADAPTEVYAVTELVFPGPAIPPTDAPVFLLETRGQRFEGFYTAPGEYRIRMVTRETGAFPFVLHSGISGVDGLSGTLYVLPENPARRHTPSGKLKSRWSDILDEAFAENAVYGVKTVNCHRQAFLRDFAARFERCARARDEA